MSANPMTSMQRVLTTLGHQNADRVPMMLLLTMHGAKELGISIKEYFSSARAVVEGQLRMREKYGNDCIYSIFYAAVETEAMGGEVVYVDDGPPNAGEPLISTPDSIRKLSIPPVKEARPLQKVLEATRLLKTKVGDEVPIIGVVMSPFSLPVMQLGFPQYLDVLHDHPDLFEVLMEKNLNFTVEWANAQLEAGATAICYFDPVSSPSMIPREMFLKTGKPVASKAISRINGPVAMHLASGRTETILDDVAEVGAAIIGTSSMEDLHALKSKARGKITILGNLDGIKMCNWSREDAHKATRSALEAAGKGGGFILADNHGEIPFQVDEDILLEIAETVREFGL